MKGFLPISLLALSLLLFYRTGAQAVKLEAVNWQFGINAFLDTEYTWMEQMPMLMKGGKSGVMPETSTFDQNHLNILLGAEKNKTRVNINIHSHHAFSSGHTGKRKGELELDEAYGTYTFSDRLSLEAGFLLTPFGIYNSMRYVTPLFATVVLPQMYEMPPNYNSPELPEQLEESLMPPKTNLMLTGRFFFSLFEAEYSIYITNGFRGESGQDENTDKGFGARVRLTAMDNYKLGFSIYDANDSQDSEDIGRTRKLGFDAELLLLDEFLKFEYEFVRDDFDKREHRYSFYVRTTLFIKGFSPFASFDFAKDRGHDLYKKGQRRYSLGTGYSLSDTVTLKAEYHYHLFSNADKEPVLTSDLKQINMFRGAIIFAF